MAHLPPCPHCRLSRHDCTCKKRVGRLILRVHPCVWCRRPIASDLVTIEGLCSVCSRIAATGGGPKLARDAHIGRADDGLGVKRITSAHQVMRSLMAINQKEAVIQHQIVNRAAVRCEKCGQQFVAGLYPWRFGLCPRPCCGPASEPPLVRHKL